MPWGAVWAMPLYELALMTAAHLAAHQIQGVELTLVTLSSDLLVVSPDPDLARATARGYRQAVSRASGRGIGLGF